MKIVLDEKICLKRKLTLQEALIASAMSMGNLKAVLENMISRGIVDATGSALTTEWEKVISKLLPADDERFINLARQMMECYPKGKIPGTAFYYRCNVREVALKLRRFFEEYGDYTDEQVIKATKKFVASYRGIYDKFPLLKYFISKNKTVTDEEGENHISIVSELASTLENMEEDEDIPEIKSTDDWLMSSRN